MLKRIAGIVCLLGMTTSWSGVLLAASEKATTQPPAQLTTLDRIAYHVVKGDFAKAKEVFDSAPDRKLHSRYGKVLQELVKARYKIEESLVNDIGKVIPLEINGRLRVVMIEGVKKHVITYRIQLSGNRFGKSGTVAISDLTLSERVKRLKRLSSETQSIYEGVELVEKGRFEAAEKEFKSLSVFKRKLLEQLAKEMAASRNRVDQKKISAAIPVIPDKLTDSTDSEKRVAGEKTGSRKLDRLNDLLKVKLFEDDNLWDDAPDVVAARLKLPLETGTPRLSCYRRYLQGNTDYCGEPTYSLRLMVTGEKYNDITFIFKNQGDCVYYIPFRIRDDKGMMKSFNEKRKEELADVEQGIKSGFANITRKLTAILGKPKTQIFGKGAGREKVLRWDWRKHAFLLAGNDLYLALRIVPTRLADAKGSTGKLSDTTLRELLKDSIDRRENGDVVLKEVPTVSFGEKNYFVQSTWARYMWYLGIPADVYSLAKAGKTQPGGRINLNTMAANAADYLKLFGCGTKYVKRSTKINNIAKYVDKGMPLLWLVEYKRNFEEHLQQRQRKRAFDKKGIANYKKELEPIRKTAKRLEHEEGWGHLRLIIGYNEETNEIAYVDPYDRGNYVERWITAEEADVITTERLQIIK